MNAPASRLPNILTSRDGTSLDTDRWLEIESWAKEHDSAYRSAVETAETLGLDDLDTLRFAAHQLLRAKLALQDELATRPPLQTAAPAPEKPAEA